MTSISPLNSILAASGAANPTSSSTAGTDKTQLGSDDFMKLLVAQLKYQDPQSPADPSQFMAQTAQFTQVEKLTDIDTQLQTLVTAQLSQAASGMVGKTVAYTDGNGNPATGVVTSAKLAGSNSTVHVGNTDVPLSSVTEVQQTTTTTKTA
jgi:flagellar basal-body rod modification protein FlgD